MVFDEHCDFVFDSREILVGIVELVRLFTYSIYLDSSDPCAIRVCASVSSEPDTGTDRQKETVWDRWRSKVRVAFQQELRGSYSRDRCQQLEKSGELEGNACAFLSKMSGNVAATGIITEKCNCTTIVLLHVAPDLRRKKGFRFEVPGG